MVRAEYDAALQGWQEASVREEHRRARLMSLSAMLSSLPLLLLFLVGGTQIFAGETTIGILYVFVNLSGNVSGVMMNLPGRIAQFRRFSVNIQRLAPTVCIPTGGERI
jgi:ABC-type bacteriocin/lantibiotic exporter with double-glycine peptidase domain